MQLKLLLTIEETIAETGLSRTVLYRKLKSGELKGVKVGTRSYIRSVDLMEYLAALPRLDTFKGEHVAA